MGETTWHTGARYRHLLDLDPDLGADLDAPTCRRARQDLRAAVDVVRPGAWAPAATDGLLLLDGFVARETRLGRTPSMELLGAGDLLLPRNADPGAIVATDVRWNVLSDLRFAVLDQAFAERAARYPAVTAALIERVEARAERLCTLRTICTLVGVDERVLALIGHLCDRWGRVTPDGVVLPLRLSHRTLAQLVGSRRPTVSTAVGQLVRRGHLVRRDDGSWLLQTPPRPVIAFGQKIAVEPVGEAGVG